MLVSFFPQHPMFGHDVFGDDLTARALESCKKTVLHPYLCFLKVVSVFVAKRQAPLKTMHVWIQTTYTLSKAIKMSR